MVVCTGRQLRIRGCSLLRLEPWAQRPHRLTFGLGSNTSRSFAHCLMRTTTVSGLSLAVCISSAGRVALTKEAARVTLSPMAAPRRARVKTVELPLCRGRRVVGGDDDGREGGGGSRCVSQACHETDVRLVCSSART